MSRRLISVVMLQRTLRARVGNIINEVYKNVQKPMLFTGIARAYTPKDEDGQPLAPENLQVQLVATDVLKSLSLDLTQLWDITATRDTGNQSATADVRVDGSVVLEGVSTSNLLFLEKQLTDFRTLVTAIPTLDPAKEWVTDPTTGVSRTPRPIESTRTEKVEGTDIVVPATEKFPAQTRDRVRDKIVGTWATTHYSGALTIAQQHALIGRVNRLIDAVKIAREEANVVIVSDVNVGAALFGYLLGE